MGSGTNGTKLSVFNTYRPKLKRLFLLRYAVDLNMVATLKEPLIKLVNSGSLKSTMLR